ncbi:MAG: gamma carbonic anhydrase family protein [Proteobacteria bacterium]|nr:gamma carbonic anhydrase family protein [Pseudomonadota bacterium]MBU1583079.1 gamma carbonic anhydrase family protein [Pseudomonadota bacterium]MBU2455475.1 gamma carbonic anhydrase family protein [Pseudomonadota bacterium]MBU2630727.1 gamma carbonic anhydrase family protein [Pseudomonadota bacterium]
MTLYSYKDVKPSLHPSVFIAPTAQIIGDVHIKKNSSVWFHSVLRGDLDTIRIGERTNVQDLCVCHADIHIPLKIGNAVTIGHRSVIHGCTIEDDCLIGMGSIVMNQAVIGRGSVVAAGTVVLEKTIIPPFSLVTGSPGKVKKTYQNKMETQQAIQTMSESYMESAQSFGSKKIFYEINMK